MDAKEKESVQIMKVTSRDAGDRDNNCSLTVCRLLLLGELVNEGTNF